MVFLKNSSFDNYQLSSQRIDIWQFPLTIIPEQAPSLLNKEELNRAQRFYFFKHQRRFTAGRAIMRLILAHYLQQDASQLNFTYNQHGKPQIDHKLQLEFNLSHSGDLALLAIGQQFPLGIDLELFSARPYDGIAKHAFSLKEIEQVHLAPSTLKPLIFFHIWAQKEAFIKACGLGLAYPTQQFDVPSFLPNHQGPIVDTLHDKTWKVIGFTPQLACCAALCYQPIVQEIRYQILTEQALIDGIL